MELAELDTFLRNEESIETLQREQGKNVNDLNFRISTVFTDMNISVLK